MLNFTVTGAGVLYVTQKLAIYEFLKYNCPVWVYPSAFLPNFQGVWAILYCFLVLNLVCFI